MTYNSKIIEFQFKLIHRVYATDSYVSNFDNIVSKLCVKGNCINNIPHLFADCIRVKLFWTSFKEWLDKIEDYKVNIRTQDIIFGILCTPSVRPNYLILHAKWWIHLSRNDEQNVNFNTFLIYLKNVLSVEKCIAVNCKELMMYYQKFDDVEKSLQ